MLTEATVEERLFVGVGGPDVDLSAYCQLFDVSCWPEKKLTLPRLAGYSYKCVSYIILIQFTFHILTRYWNIVKNLPGGNREWSA